MSILEEIKLYQTMPHQCSYRKDQLASTLFVDPEIRITPEILSYLSNCGFRRSGDYLYLPNCDSCSACISARIPVNLFQPNRNQRKIWRRNSDLTCTIREPCLTDEIYRLYERYITARHADGDMYPATRDQYQSFIVDSHADSCFLEIRRDETLLAIAVTDLLVDACSAIYTFYEPLESRRSLGAFAILKQIELAREKQLQHLYLGYWIKQCKKMNYKIQYRPIELLVNNCWTLLG